MSLDQQKDVTRSAEGCHSISRRMSLDQQKDATRSAEGCHSISRRKSLDQQKDVTRSAEGCHSISRKMSLDQQKDVTRSAEGCQSISRRMPLDQQKDVTRSAERCHSISRRVSLDQQKDVTRSAEGCHSITRMLSHGSVYVSRRASVEIRPTALSHHHVAIYSANLDTDSRRNEEKSRESPSTEQLVHTGGGEIQNGRFVTQFATLTEYQVASMHASILRPIGRIEISKRVYNLFASC